MQPADSPRSMSTRAGVLGGVFFLVLGIVSIWAGLADSPIAWEGLAAAAFVFFPIGILSLIGATRERRARLCPRCASPAKKGAAVCAECGAELYRVGAQDPFGDRR